MSAIGASVQMGQALVDTRLVNKPARFGSDESQRRDWKFSFENFMARVDVVFASGITAAARCDREIGTDGWNQDRFRRSATLYAVLASLLERSPLALVMQV